MAPEQSRNKSVLTPKYGFIQNLLIMICPRQIHAIKLCSKSSPCTKKLFLELEYDQGFAELLNSVSHTMIIDHA